MHTNNFCYKKARNFQQKWIAQGRSNLLDITSEQRKNERESIHFTDSMYPQHRTKLTYCSNLKGEREEVATTSPQVILNFIGGISLNGHRLFTIKLTRLIQTTYVIFFESYESSSWEILCSRNLGQRKISQR